MASKEVNQGLSGSVLEREDIVYLSHLSTDRWIGADEAYSRGLTARNRVVFVERPLSPARFLFAPGRLRRARRQIKRLNRIGDNLFSFTPPFLWPLESRFDFVKRRNDKKFAAAMRKAVKKIGMNDPILIVSSFMVERGQIVEDIQFKAVCYLCADYLAAGDPGRRATRHLKSAEEKFLRRSDLVITCSPLVYEARKPLSRRIHNLPHGLPHVDQIGACASPLRDLDNLGRPILMTVGTIDEKLDWELISDLATANPHWSFVFIGPIGPRARYSFIGPNSRLRRMKRFANIHFLGQKPSELIPDYLRRADVCLVPYRLDGLNRYRDPTKVGEYIAQGKPVVSVAIPALERFGPLVKIANNSEEFGVLAAAALESKENGVLVEERLAYARAHSWSSNVSQFSKLIRDALTEKATAADPVCPVCAATVTGEPVEAANGYRLFYCRKCGLQFWHPFRALGVDWYQGVDAPYSGYRFLQLAEQLRWPHRHFFKTTLSGGSRLIDIGCGGGTFMRAAQETGYHVAGIDFDPLAVKICRRTGLTDVECSTIEQAVARANGDRFDLVTFFDVLEHVDDPVGFIQDAKKLLKDDGRLVFSVPNRNGWRGKQWNRLIDSPPHHLTRWDRASLTALLEQTRMSVEGYFESPVLLEDCLADISYSLRLNAVKQPLVRLLGRFNKRTGAVEPDGGDKNNRARIAESLYGWHKSVKQAAIFVPALIMMACLKASGRPGMGILVIAKPAESSRGEGHVD